MKIAVTSASGQLGGAIVRQLKKEVAPNQIIAIARTPQKAEHLGVEVRQGDYNSFEAFSIALKGVDTVLLVSGRDEPQKRIGQHRNVIEAARLNGVRKMVYTSIIGDEEKNAFSPIVQSNRQTEQDVIASGLEWVVGRNGIYIEPDLEYLDTYVKEGGITNCAGSGRCTYTSRPELGYAYAKMILEDQHNGSIYNLAGEPITQAQLAKYINQVYGTALTFRNISPEAYIEERKTELGDFLGTVIAGIYEGILSGAYDLPSDFTRASGRAHQSALELIRFYKSSQ
ncbi:MAG: NAD(P)H-binding protein [Mameliella sp.]|nr:NAD(P)H-binding protein [Phaeodactylibacter sp.]